MRVLKKLNITFDDDGNTTISREKLHLIIHISRSEKIFADAHSFPNECYILVDRNGIDFYPFPVEEYLAWEKDGSFEMGDVLYKMSIIKKY